MLREIREQLLNGSIQNIAIYGSSHLPPTPYVVVKRINDSLGRGTVYEVFAHFDADYQLDLIDYVKKELPLLLDGFTVYDSNGYKKELSLKYGTDTGLYKNDDDNTIQLSRQFLSANVNGF